jgi:hypothetical protein
MKVDAEQSILSHHTTAEDAGRVAQAAGVKTLSPTRWAPLGHTGMEVSRLCLGCMTFGVPDRGTHPWTLDEETSREMTALEAPYVPHPVSGI